MRTETTILQPPTALDDSDNIKNSQDSTGMKSHGSSSYLSLANDSMQFAMDQTSAALTGLVSTLYTIPTRQGESTAAGGGDPSPLLVAENETDKQQILLTSQIVSQQRRRLQPEWLWIWRNPHTSVRGHHQSPSSVDAVRSLLTLVPVDEQSLQKSDLEDPEIRHRQLSSISEDQLGESVVLDHHPQPSDYSAASSRRSHRRGSWMPYSQQMELEAKHHDLESSSERASQLAEGTIRALRDLALDEALELHDTLRFWTARWEQPLWSWLEAGPWEWYSENGYNHAVVGQKVSQTQAVLARRCAVIGELQEHLLRAGWQRGVAQWGVLGQGGQWANVAGFDGTIADSASSDGAVMSHSEAGVITSDLGASASYMASYQLSRRFSADLDGWDESNLVGALPGREKSITNLADLEKQQAPNKAAYYYYGDTHVVVGKTDGGGIVTDDPSLAAWSIDAMRLVRECLHRAGNGLVALPHGENWTIDGGMDIRTDGTLIAGGVEDDSHFPNGITFPKWASRETVLVAPPSKTVAVDDATDGPLSMDADETGLKPEQKDNHDEHVGTRITVTNLSLLAAEVSDLVNAMELIMQLQRRRRLERLRGPSYLRRNWYVAAAGAPIATYIAFRLLYKGYGIHLAKFVAEKVTTFFNEHVSAPLKAIYLELFSRQRRETISDHKARLDAIESLKKMIRSWLDETYPKMPLAERIDRAERCDMSLIEHRKEENMKTIYEINSVVRMSLIEMQFIKKEMMNAMYAMDDMMTSNEINMNLAAVTPAVLLLYGVRYVARFSWYFLLRLGKSREEVYASFRHIILDMERLLTMRDRPPAIPPPLSGTPQSITTTDAPLVLSSDDLGMLMLHIHECRTILWKDRRRFSPQICRDVAEDLAELAGERGAVSVAQQLRIIARMCRTYPFLKVVSTGVTFDLSRQSLRRQ